jgi:hypothetical protein
MTASRFGAADENARVQGVVSKLLLTAIAALLMATSAAHAEEEPNPLKVRAPETIATLPAKQSSSPCKLDMELVDGEIHANSNCWGKDLWLKLRGIAKCYPAYIDKLERQDDISYLEYSHCGSIKRVYLYTLEKYADLGIYNTENY